MNRISPIVFVVLVPLVLIAAAYTTGVTALQPTQASPPTSTSMPPQPTTVQGTVTYRELVPLAADAVLTVQLVEISRADGAEAVLGEQIIPTTGSSGPFAFEIRCDPEAIRPNDECALRAKVAVDGKVVYWTRARLGVIAQGDPTIAQLVLTKVGPWSSLDLVLSSGRLARFSH